MAEQIKFGDKLFLKGETLILDNGASDAVIKSSNGTLKIDGNLTVSGTQTVVESETVTIADNILLVNSNVTGAPSENGGIEVERGTSDNASILWNETSDKFELKVGSASADLVANIVTTTSVTGAFSGDLSGNVTSTGLSTFADVDINGGNIDGTVIGASVPQAGTFTTLNATTITGAVTGDLTGDVTGTVSSIANHDTDDLAEGTNNLYYTQARVDARYAQLQADSNFIETLDGQTGSYYLDYNNFTNIPSVIGSIDDLSDVDTTTNAPTTGQTIIWNGTNFVPGNNFSQSDFDSAFTAKDTDDLSEGTSNLYYTDTRARNSISLNNSIGSGSQPMLEYSVNSGTFTSKDLVSGNGTTVGLVHPSLNLGVKVDLTADLSQLQDVSTTAPSSGQVLKWSGSEWAPGTDETHATTDTLTEGSTNLYYTAARDTAQFNTDLATKSTTDLAEGTNLYYTDARARAVSIENIVEDTTPQLGGNLDLNTYDLTTTDPTVTLTTTTTAVTTQGTVGASTETNLSNATVTVNTQADVANAVSSYITLSSTSIDALGFKGESSLTYFGSAASTSNFVWRDLSDSAEQNNMVVVYSPPADTYTFTLPTDPTFPINSLDSDIYFKQYAYGEMTVTSSTALNGNTIQLRDASGFYIDKDHVAVTALGGNSYKIVFWTHDVSSGDVIDVIASSAQTALFEWGTSTFAETGFTMTAESFSLQSSTNDIFAMGDLEFTAGLTTGEVVGTLIYDEPSSKSILSGLTTVTFDGTSYLSAQTITDVPIVLTGNASTTNELSIAVGGPLDTVADARLWLMDSSGDLIYKFPAADGTANQVMKTDGSGDISWQTQTTDHVTEGSSNLYYTTARDTAQFNTDLATKTTTNLAEGTNLYYTDARADARVNLQTGTNLDLSSKTTSELSEGSNLYYTDARADARAQLKIDALVDSAPGTLDTLNELAAALGDDANFSTTITNQISALTHDGFADFVANEHIDWTQSGAGTIHASNYSNTNTGILSVVEDTSPQLGADLDLQTYDITTSSSDFDIKVGTGNTITTIGMGQDSGSGFTAEGVSISSSTNAGSDILLLGDLNYTSGIYTGEFIGQVAHDNATSRSGYFGLSTVTENSTTYVANTMFSAEPQLIHGNVGTSNAVSLAIGTGSDNRIHQLNASGNTIFKFPAADGSANQILTTDGSGDLSWSNPSATVDITGNIIPATDDTYNLGSTTKKYANIYGHSIQATYADLAERYAADGIYEAGTVVVFGGEAEVTTTTEAQDVSVAGVISTNPALKLNADAGNSQTHPYVALRGRVPCQIIGPVSKGDLIVTADNEPGFAQSVGKNDTGRSVFAKSIETDLTEGKKLIEVVIL